MKTFSDLIWRQFSYHRKFRMKSKRLKKKLAKDPGRYLSRIEKAIRNRNSLICGTAFTKIECNNDIWKLSESIPIGEVLK